MSRMLKKLSLFGDHRMWFVTRGFCILEKVSAIAFLMEALIYLKVEKFGIIKVVSGQSDYIVYVYMPFIFMAAQLIMSLKCTTMWSSVRGFVALSAAALWAIIAARKAELSINFSGRFELEWLVPMVLAISLVVIGKQYADEVRRHKDEKEQA